MAGNSFAVNGLANLPDLALHFAGRPPPEARLSWTDDEVPRLRALPYGCIIAPGGLTTAVIMSCFSARSSATTPATSRRCFSSVGSVAAGQGPMALS